MGKFLIFIFLKEAGTPAVDQISMDLRQMLGLVPTPSQPEQTTNRVSEPNMEAPSIVSLVPNQPAKLDKKTADSAIEENKPGIGNPQKMPPGLAAWCAAQV